MRFILIILAALPCVAAEAQVTGQRVKLELHSGDEYIGHYVARQDGAMHLFLADELEQRAVPFGDISAAYASTGTRSLARRGALIGMAPIPLFLVLGLAAGRQADDENEEVEKAFILAGGGLGAAAGLVVSLVTVPVGMLIGWSMKRDIWSNISVDGGMARWSPILRLTPDQRPAVGLALTF